MTLHLAPIGLRAANAWVDQVHRHHQAVAGHKFSTSVVNEHGELRGVAIAGRPSAKALDDGTRLEVLRVAVLDAPNACSLLYGACARAGQAMGYARHNILTYTLEDEPGTSLLAAGWVRVRLTKPEDWDRPSRRRRTDRAPDCRKWRWHAAMPSGIEVAA